MGIDTDVQKQIKSLYLSGNSGHKISQITGISSGTVYNYLKLLGITRSNKINSRKYSLNHEYFSEIDLEHKAYWLGFIQADGYLLTGTPGIGIALAEVDRGHLEKFKNSIEADYPIKTYRGNGYSQNDYVRIIVKSEKMWNDLNNLGVTPQKTKTTLPIKVDKGLERHYIRGLMDGDGSIKISKSSKAGYRGDFVSATPEMATYIADALGKGAVRFDKNKNVWYSEFTLTIKNLDYLYDEATVYLSRKHARAVLGRSRISKVS
jgi:hypothetical protein